MKKLLALLLSLTMVFTLGVTAWAEGPTDVATAAELKGAITSAATDGTLKEIRLTESITVEGAVIVIDNGKNISIDLNGKNIDFAGSGHYYFKLQNGTLTFTGSGTVFERAPYYSPIVITSSATSTDANYSVLNVGEDVTLKGFYGVMIDQYNKHAYGVVVNVDGELIGITDGSDLGAGLYLNGEAKDSTGEIPEININSTASISADGHGIYAAGYGVWNIMGGMITGDQVGVEIRAGELNISGGTITGNGSPASSNPNGNGTTAVGPAVAVAQHTTKLPVTVNVTGGELVSEYSYALYAGNPENNPADDIKNVEIKIEGGTLTGEDDGDGASAIGMNMENVDNKVPDDNVLVTGGVFSSDVSGYCVSPYTCSPAGNDTFKVAMKEVTVPVTADKVTEPVKTVTPVLPAGNTDGGATLTESGKAISELAVTEVVDTKAAAAVDNELPVQNYTVIELMDIALKDADGNTLELKGGASLTVIIPFPEGYNANNIGKVQLFHYVGDKWVEVAPLTITAAGIQFELVGPEAMSPFAITYGYVQRDTGATVKSEGKVIDSGSGYATTTETITPIKEQKPVEQNPNTGLSVWNFLINLL